VESPHTHPLRGVAIASLNTDKRRTTSRLVQTPKRRFLGRRKEMCPEETLQANSGDHSCAKTGEKGTRRKMGGQARSKNQSVPLLRTVEKGRRQQTHERVSFGVTQDPRGSS